MAVIELFYIIITKQIKTTLLKQMFKKNIGINSQESTAPEKTQAVPKVVPNAEPIGSTSLDSTMAATDNQLKSNVENSNDRSGQNQAVDKSNDRSAQKPNVDKSAERSALYSSGD